MFSNKKLSNNLKKRAQNIRRKYTKRKVLRKIRSKKNKKISFLKIFSFIIFSFLLFLIIWWVIFYYKDIAPLPPVENLKNMKIAESSVIYDRHWKELYKIFKEKRTYVDYDNISKNMINAIVAWEDQRFWTTPWFDIIWIIRSIIVWLIHWEWPHWTSGISQQLMKVTYLTSERKIERKLKELYLSRKLNKVFDKKKILELYLNKIFFWANSYWIEQASLTFFGVWAKDLNVLQSAILASLPKAPSWLSPYNHKDKLLWYPYIYEEKKQDQILKLLNKKDIIIYNSLVKKLENFINNLKFKRVNDRVLVCWLSKKFLKKQFRIDSDWCSLIDYSDLLILLNSIRIKDWKNYIEYQTWRKDYILWRMLEDKYISFSDYKKAIIDSFWFKFKKYSDKIKYPYFVMYVKEYLEKKYWKDIVEKWWLRIYTTLDSDLQDEAEALIKKYWPINEKRFWAKNDAIVSIDNKSGWILAMVWGRDYFDVENWWNNNMITSRLQPWSTFKPFVYALAIKNNRIWTKTPVYDLKTVFPWNYSPSNFDWKYMWKMNISTALDNSRNIPAIKMFYLAWGENKIINFMEKLWVKTLRDFKKEYYNKYHKKYVYWASMALWTWLMTPLELAWAYSVFANLWKKKDITPILKVIDSKWNVIEDNTIKKKEKVPVISPALAYIMNTILSDSSSRPAFWNKYMTIPWRKLAAKTGTSTKQYYKNWRKIIAPRNLWTVGYTPQITTVVWVWNTDWKQLYLNWNWLEWAGPIMRGFMNYAHKKLIVQNWKRPVWVRDVKISEISWKLPNPDTFPKNLIVDSLFINPPKTYDNSLKEVEVDSLCNWIVTPETPETAIKKWYYIAFHSLKPDNPAWENPVQAWVKKWEWKKRYSNFWNIITDFKNEPCKRSWKANILINSNIKEWQILATGINYLEFWFKWDRPIVKARILLNNTLLKEIKINNKLKWVEKVSYLIPKDFTNKTANLIVQVIDIEGYAYSDSQNVQILWKDIIWPKIILKNDLDNTLNSWEKFEISWEASDSSWVRSVNIYLDSKPLKIWINNNRFSYLLDTTWLSKWLHIIKVQAYDYNFNSSFKEINLIIK